MEKFILRISELKSEVITYCGFIIDDCFVFSFEDGCLFYIPTNRLELYKSNGKLYNYELNNNRQSKTSENQKAK